MDEKRKVIIVDDEESMRIIIKRALENEVDTLLAANGEEALEIFNREEISLVISDISMPVMDGLTLLQKIKSLNSDIPVIMITGHDQPRLVEKALMLDVFDYLQKPIESHLVKILAARALERYRLLKEINKLKTIKGQREDIQLIGQSSVMKEFFLNVDSVEPSSKIPVLIVGETGTGKKLAARAIHEKSERSDFPFVSFDCTAGKGEALLGRLFGHEKGAFAGANEKQLGLLETADGGTLFLDEIGEMEIDVQVKFLRFLDSNGFFRIGGNKLFKVDVRIIAATNRPLNAMVSEKRFIEDLYLRLSKIKIKMPSLSERGIGDIKLLIDYYLERFEREIGHHILGFSEDSLNAMLMYKWPGNIRELKNVIERLTLLNNNKEISLEALPEELSIDSKREKAISIPYNIPFAESEGLFQKCYLTALLKECKGDVVKAATISRVDEKSLEELLKRHCITHP